MKYFLFKLLFFIFSPLLMLMIATTVWFPKLSIQFMNILLAIWGLGFKEFMEDLENNG